jgi:microsomal dipeptidase-like Zn-dependent dipeptidase
MGPDGARLVDYMVDRRMLIDAAHMSERAVQDYHDYLTSKYPGYPLYNSHARFQPVLDGDDKEILKEFLVTESQIKLYQDLGGMVGVRTGWEHICDAPDHRLRLGEKWKANCGGKPGEKEPKPAVANSCPGSSRSFAQLVDFADKSDLNIAFGSDLNGNTYQVGPRYGLEQCYANRVLKKGYVDDQGPAPRAVSQEFNEHGLAHIGLLPDLLADLKALNTPGVARLERSAENFIQMWERAYDAKLAAVTNEPACKQDSDCVGGWYCSTGLTGLEPNKCKPKLEGGQACLNDRQCASGSCSPWRPQDGQASGICYTPSSVAAGGSCRIDLECKTGKCNSKKECVCKVDSDCGAGQWCDAGVDLKENVCRRKFRTGEVCGTALELNVGHRCLSGECKLHGVSKNLTCR